MQRFEDKYFKKTGRIIFPVFLFLTFMVSISSIAQFHEFGIGAGGFNYTGDINPRYNFTNYRPGGMLFYRYNSKNSATAFRLGFSVGQLAGSEKHSKELISTIRSASFKSTLTEISLMGEYNFINYRNRKQLIKFSPYMTGGLAFFAGSSGSVIANSKPENKDTGGLNFAIPFGVGVKFILNKNWNLGTEFVARKTFTDYLDGISNADIGKKSTGNPLDSDWYFYTGITLSYTVFKVDCPQGPAH
jgi:hypothetical protein